MTTPPGTPVVRPYVPGPAGWVPAPDGFVPPLGWIPGPAGWMPSPPGWTPPAGWVHTPSGWLPPPPGQLYPGGHLQTSPGAHGPDAGTRGFGWPVVLPRARQFAAAVADRKPRGLEIIVVLLVFPAQAVVDALVALAQTITHQTQLGGYAAVIVPDAWVSAFLNLLLELTQFAPAILVIYLLQVSGGGLRAIGLDRTQPRTDAARAGKLIFLAYVGPFILVGILSNITNGNPASQNLKGLSLLYLIPLLVSAVSAGVVEEIVVLGYLVHRLEQRGWTGWKLVALCTAVRVSYHLYYGWGAFGIAVWGALSVVLFRRRRRLLSFIVAHILWDGTQFIGIFLHGGWQALPEVVTLFVVFPLLWFTARDSVVGEVFESRRLLRTNPAASHLPD